MQKSAGHCCLGTLALSPNRFANSSVYKQIRRLCDGVAHECSKGVTPWSFRCVHQAQGNMDDQYTKPKETARRRLSPNWLSRRRLSQCRARARLQLQGHLRAVLARRQCQGRRHEWQFVEVPEASLHSPSTAKLSLVRGRLSNRLAASTGKLTQAGSRLRLSHRRQTTGRLCVAGSHTSKARTGQTDEHTFLADTITTKDKRYTNRKTDNRLEQ